VTPPSGTTKSTSGATKSKPDTTKSKPGRNKIQARRNEIQIDHCFKMPAMDLYISDSYGDFLS
jgi:hypothetical protein